MMSKTLLVRWADDQIDEKSLPVNLNLQTDLVKTEAEPVNEKKNVSKYVLQFFC